MLKILTCFPLRLCVSAVILLSLAAAAPGEEPFGLSLLDPDSLTGWEHSAEPAKGWTIEKGVLRGSKDSSTLVSGWTFGNFELRLNCEVRERGELTLGFPPVPQGPGMTITVGGNSRVTIRRHADALTIAYENRQTVRHTISSSTRLGLSLTASGGPVEVSEIRVREFGSGDEPDGASLFNGRDLTGWWTPGSKNAWGVQDGNLALVGENGNYLRSDKEYGNYTLSLEYKIRKRGNSGIGIRTARNGWPSGDGMEMQIEDSRKLDASATMAIYRNLEPIALAEKTEDWNHAVIKADGRMISAWLNGVLVQQANTAFLPELRHRPLKGWIGFQDHGAPIQFRNLRIIEAPDGLGLDAWYTPRIEPASRFVLDRLMNPERLAVRDGSNSSAAHARLPDSGEHVLADLKGPGAVVRIAGTSDAAKIALFFDGESKPRIDCPMSQLNQLIPQVCGDGTTFLGYAKSLKVVLRDGQNGNYRIERVALPPEMTVESFRPKAAGIERGLLAAIDYRHFQMSYGTYRDNDPLPRAASGNKTLAPGERVSLISLEGAGMVKWLRLHGDAKLLENDDLWLEVTVAGESQPALATPARFFFPGLDSGKNFHNFLVFNKGGFTNVLPMPYGRGITIAAINRGPKELKNVGLSVSYQPGTAEDASNRLRLRGAYASAESPIAGHCIGQIWEATDSAETEQTRCLSGRSKTLNWSFHLLAPLNRDTLSRMESPSGRRLALFYSQ